jgi:hypothetical protein
MKVKSPLAKKSFTHPPQKLIYRLKSDASDTFFKKATYSHISPLRRTFGMGNLAHGNLRLP